MSSVSVALFTRDLRVHDNPVLSRAARNGQTVPLFVFDDAAPKGFLRPNRATFLVQSLEDLDAQLQQRGGRLVVRDGKVVDEVCAVAAEVGASQVHVAVDVSGYAQAREKALASALRAEGRELVVHESSVNAASPGQITPHGKDHFAVFTPYYNRWAQQPIRRSVDAPARVELPDVYPGRLPRAGDLCSGQTSPFLPPGGETSGRRRLAAWNRRVDAYAENNDRLADDATSRLSPYLHLGCVSPVELIHRLGHGSAGSDAFLRQLAWRDFHHQVLAARPDAARDNYRDRDDTWRDDPVGLEAWRRGRTGYPVVDAGMRQLIAEGWMHNRARLIVASFLAKTMYVDWRLGASHFLDLLVDGDIANNQMNWQWMAGTGTDTRPHRVLNPVLQGRRYDPEGDYVRRYVPELAGVEGSAVHEPWKLSRDVLEELDYPGPIVELDEGLRRFRSARGKD
ncbi:MAG: DNA photolyase family protein [Actinomycetota bacterium]|nr:DNA photolyase family protein [Actinomycetota bacterium]